MLLYFTIAANSIQPLCSFPQTSINTQRQIMYSLARIILKRFSFRVLLSVELLAIYMTRNFGLRFYFLFRFLSRYFQWEYWVSKCIYAGDILGFLVGLKSEFKCSYVITFNSLVYDLFLFRTNYLMLFERRSVSSLNRGI